MDEQVIKELKEGMEPEVFKEALAFLEQNVFAPFGDIFSTRLPVTSYPVSYTHLDFT